MNRKTEKQQRNKTGREHKQITLKGQTKRNKDKRKKRKTTPNNTQRKTKQAGKWTNK